MTKPTPMESMNDVIWLKLCETDPKRTKDFYKGYSGTSVNPNYIYEKLTTVFGPCGIGWGFEVTQDRYVKGANFDADGVTEQTHDLQIQFWYKNGDNISKPIPAYGCTQYVYKDKNGWHTDEDAPKKSLTDALTKASQFIGMSADIFGGLWDDNKYVKQLEEKFGAGNSKPSADDAGSEGKSEPKPAPNENKADPKTVSEKQAGFIYHKFRDSGFSAAQIKRWIQYHYQVESNFKLPREAFDYIKEQFDGGTLEPIPDDAGKTAEDDIPF